MLGTINDDNAPMVMHYCQEQLGITKKRPFLAFRQYFLANNGDINKLRVNDVGGALQEEKNYTPYSKNMEPSLVQIRLVKQIHILLTAIDLLR